MTDHGTGEYLDNMSTLYDLSYNYYPKCANGPLHRKLRSKIPKFIPEDDYLPSFVSCKLFLQHFVFFLQGNLTKYGILELKQEQWKCDKGVVRRTGTTSYQETYLPPKKEDYLFKKWAVPLLIIFYQQLDPCNNLLILVVILQSSISLTSKPLR